MARLVKVATPAAAVAVVLPLSFAPVAPLPATRVTLTTVALSEVSAVPLLRTCTTGWVASAMPCNPFAGCVESARVFCGGGGAGAGAGAGEAPPPPPQPASEASTRSNPPGSTDLECMVASGHRPGSTIAFGLRARQPVATWQREGDHGFGAVFIGKKAATTIVRANA